MPRWPQWAVSGVRLPVDWHIPQPYDMPLHAHPTIPNKNWPSVEEAFGDGVPVIHHVFQSKSHPEHQFHVFRRSDNHTSEPNLCVRMLTLSDAAAARWAGPVVIWKNLTGHPTENYRVIDHDDMYTDIATWLAAH